MIKVEMNSQEQQASVVHPGAGMVVIFSMREMMVAMDTGIIPVIQQV